jgi:hypothetical protein
MAGLGKLDISWNKELGSLL